MAKKQQDPALEEVGISEPYQVVPVRLTVPPGAPETLARTGRLIYWQLSQAMGDFAKAGLAKDSKNLQQGFSFRGIDSLMNLAAPILVRHGIVITPRVLGRTVDTRETKNGTLLYNVALDVEFMFISAVDGSQHSARVTGEAMDSGDKATNKALSAALKYAMLQTFCIPVDGSDDADQTTPEETVALKEAPPAGYDAVRAGAMEASLLGTEALRAFARTLGVGGKDTPEFKAWGYLVKHDPAYGLMKTSAESADKKAAMDALTREPGQEG